jgi:hypothetical protein
LGIDRALPPGSYLLSVFERGFDIAVNLLVNPGAAIIRSKK